MTNRPMSNRPSRARRFVGVAWRRRLLVLAGGISGSWARLAVTEGLAIWPRWPLATLTVNLVGSFLLGWLLVRLAAGSRPLTYTIPLLGIGVLGAFTTFGAFALDLWLMLGDGRWVSAVSYLAASVIGGLFLAVLGSRLGAGR